jgi:hypothetical protein
VADFAGERSWYFCRERVRTPVEIETRDESWQSPWEQGSQEETMVSGVWEVLTRSDNKPFQTGTVGHRPGRLVRLAISEVRAHSIHSEAHDSICWKKETRFVDPHFAEGVSRPVVLSAHSAPLSLNRRFRGRSRKNFYGKILEGNGHRGNILWRASSTAIRASWSIG